MRNVILLIFFCFTGVSIKGQFKSSLADAKKFCYTTSAGKYEISLEEGSDNKAYYKLYNGSGQLSKTMQGFWEIRDEGVYGSLYVLTLRWSGLNADMPSLKFTCQYNASGQLQQLIDSQKRNWYPCY
jgi:hypothetical protein